MMRNFIIRWGVFAIVGAFFGFVTMACSMLKGRPDVDQMERSQAYSSSSSKPTPSAERSRDNLQSSSADTSSNGDSPEASFIRPDSRNSDSPRKRIMVLPFLDGDPEHSGDGARLARNALIKELSKSDDLVLVGPSDFPKNFSSYLKDGEYDLPAMAKVAETLGVAGLLEGKLFEVRSKRLGDSVGFLRHVSIQVDAKIRLRLIATKNSQILLNETRTSSVQLSTTRVGEKASSDRLLEEDPKLTGEAVKKAFLSLAQNVVLATDKLSWEGRIAMIKGDKIYINSGRLSGLQVGDILKVLEEGEDVYDPETGALVGRVPGRLKGTLELVSYFGRDGAVSVVHSGAGFKENDIVQLY